MSDAAARRAEILARILNERGATELDPTAPMFPTMELAAIAALDAIMDGAREHGGLIFRHANGRFGYSVPVPGDSDSFSLRARFNPQELSMAGIYHTHNDSGPLAGVFSASDVETARRMQLISFIKALGNGEIRRFDPDSSRVKRDSARGVGKQRRVTSRGELVREGER